MKKLLFILFIVFLVSACQDNIEIIEEDTQEESQKTTEEVKEEMAAGNTEETQQEETTGEEPADMGGITGAFTGGSSSGGIKKEEQPQTPVTPQQLMQASAPTPVCDLTAYNECMQTTSTGLCLGNCPIISVPCQGSTASLGCFDTDPACAQECEDAKEEQCRLVSNCP